MDQNKMSFKEAIIVFLLIVVFVISIATILFHNRMDNVENRITTVEQTISNI